jgi:hypothetical protein
VESWLTLDVHVLNAAQGGFAPVLHRDALGLAAFAFTDRAAAERTCALLTRAPQVPTGARGGSARAPQGASGSAARRAPRVLTLAARDARAREEWLRSVDAAGGARVLFDPDVPPSGPPARGVLTRALLADVLAGKRFVACL